MNENLNQSVPASEPMETSHGGLTVKHANIFYLIHIVFALALSSFKIPGLPMT